MGLLPVDHAEVLFVTGRDPFTKNKILALGHPSDRILIAQYFGSTIILGFSLTYPDFNRLIRRVLNEQLVTVHLDLLHARTGGAASAGPSDHLPKRAPAEVTVEGADFLDQFDQRNAAILEEVVVGDDEARLPQEKIESKVLQTMESVPSRENWKAAVCHDGYVPDVPDSCPRIFGVHRDDLGIDRRKKTVALENLWTYGRENALREDHDGIVLDARSHLMISHSGSSQI